MTPIINNSVRYSDFSPTSRAHGAMQKVKKTSKRQDNQINKTLQGVLVNTYIKDNEAPQSDMDEICNNLVIPDEFNKHSVLKDLPHEKEPQKKKSLLRSAAPYALSALLATGMAVVISNSYAKSQALLKPGNVPNGVKLPAVGKNINLKSEEYFAVYMAVSEPKAKNILALGAVFAMSALTYVGKTFLDGIKSVWLKKQESDIKKNFEENVIDIETKSFAGKLDVIRQQLVEKSQYFKEKLALAPSKEDLEEKPELKAFAPKPSFAPQNFSMLSGGQKTQQNPLMAGVNPLNGGQYAAPQDIQAHQRKIFSNFFAFKGNTEPPKAPKKETSKDKMKNFYDNVKDSPLALALVSAATLGIMFLGGRQTFKNISKGAKIKEQAISANNEKIRQSLANATESFKQANTESARESLILSIKEKLLSLGADFDEILKTFKDLGLGDDKAQKLTEEVSEAVSKLKFGEKFYVQADPAMGGKEGTQFYIYIDQAKGYIYDVITHPENKFARYLFSAITATGACGYAMKEAVDAVKEQTVMKENSQTELELQNRLVDTEIRNFKSKKESAIEPMMIEFNTKFEEGKSKEELKVMAENILLEIKNGPPFVYA